MTDASESPETQPEPAPDTQPEVSSDARSERKRAAKKRFRSDTVTPGVMTRFRLTNDLGVSLRSYEAEITQALEEELAPFLEEGERLELTSLLRAVGRLVEDRQARVERAHSEHAQELAAGKERQRETHRRFRELRRVMVDLRQTVKSLYGRTAVRKYLGFDQPTGREPLLLLRQAQKVLHNLRDPELPRPKSRFGSETVDWGWWIDKLEPLTRALNQAARERDHDTATTQISHRAKHLELERYDRQVHAAARWIAATLELAELKDLGADLLPRTRRRRRRLKTDSDQNAAAERSDRGSAEATEASPEPPPASAEGVSRNP
jgi:hypothetical protein